MMKFSLGKDNFRRNVFMKEFRWNISTYSYQTLVVDIQYGQWKEKKKGKKKVAII